MKLFEEMKIVILMGLVLLEGTNCQVNLVNQASGSRTVKMEQCMTICECDEISGLVDCSDVGLKRIPDSFPSYAVTVVLSRNQITSIEENAFAGLQFLKVLYITDNLISRVDENSFSGVPSLETLDLENNNIDTWSSNITRPVSSTLKVLDLSRNSLWNITASMFAHPMPKLHSLYIEENTLREIEDSSFSYLTNLKTLSLKINLIGYLNPNGTTLEGLGSLEQLYFDFNFFSILPEPNAFRFVQDNLQVLSFAGQQRTNSIPSLSFPKLESFNISFCSIDIVRHFSFVDVPQLITLDITGNRITTIEEKAFSGLNLLKTLRLSQNNLLYFPYQPLILVSASLEYLYADYLAISRISKTPFDEENILLKNLLFLSFQTTNIHQIDGESFFKNLKRLKTLILSKSQLTEIPSAALASLSSMEQLTFNGNLITNLTSTSFPLLPSLIHLEINESPSLSFIGNETFDSFGKTLQRLFISSGSLKTLPRYSLATLDQLKHLDLSNNRLQRAYTEWMEGKTLSSLMLEGNPWECDCMVTDFKSWLSSEEYMSITQKDEVTCYNPRYIRGTFIAEVDENELTCKATECPKMCLCDYQNTRTDIGRKVILDSNSTAKITKVDCSGEGLKIIPDGIPSTTLDFSMDNNRLTSLSSTSLQSITSTEKLFLSRNSITSLESTAFSLLVNLKELDLQSNVLYTLPSVLFANLSRLETLKLKNNRLENIETEMFLNLQKLTFLDLSYNNLDYLKNDTFSGLTNLQDLILSYNFISFIEQGTLCPLQNLRNLYLSHNYIYTWNPDLVVCNQQLGTVDIGGNSIQQLNSYFMSSESISYIKMEGGKLKEIADFAFAGFPNLRTVRLGNNYISNISNDAFKIPGSSAYAAGDSLITSLDFGSNSLSEFPLKALQPLSSLQALYLNNNPITSLDPAEPPLLPYLPSLISLQLAKTKIYAVNASSILQYISNLQILSMNECELSEIPFNVFQSLPLLNTLNIDGNPIGNISKDDFPSHSQMRYFSLRFNDKLTQINEKAFTNLPNLSAIQLDGGRSISSIAGNAFDGLKHVEAFDISDNNLITPRKEWFSSFTPGELASVSMYNNPWVCDCNALPYKRWLDVEAGSFEVYTLSVTCDEPMHLKGTAIEDAQDILACSPTSTAAQTNVVTRTMSETATTQTTAISHTISETTSNSNKLLLSTSLLVGNFILSFKLTDIIV